MVKPWTKKEEEEEEEVQANVIVIINTDSTEAAAERKGRIVIAMVEGSKDYGSVCLLEYY